MNNRRSIPNVGMNIMLEDLKNPLTTIILASERLTENDLPEDEKAQLIKFIQDGTRNMHKHIEEMCKYLQEASLEHSEL